MKAKTIKLSRKSIGEYLCDLGIGKFLRQDMKKK